MSEPVFPSSGEPAAPDDAAAEPGKSNYKVLLALGSVLAALVVAGGAFLLLSGSGDDSDAAFVVPKPAASTTAAPVASPKAVVQPASVTVGKRNPFAPLYPSPTASPTGSNTADPDNGGDVTPTVNPEPTVTPVTLVVTAIDMGKQLATVSVDAKKYPKLTVGDSFGGYYTLYSIFNSQCVGVLYGDLSVPLCLGKPASVTP